MINLETKKHDVVVLLTQNLFLLLKPICLFQPNPNHKELIAWVDI